MQILSYLIINVPLLLRKKKKKKIETSPFHFLGAYNHRRDKFTWEMVWRVTEQHHSFPFFHSDLGTFLRWERIKI